MTEDGLLDLAARALAEPESGPLAVAVSGGGDSLALLDLLSRCDGARGRLAAVTVDHGLRPDSAAVAAGVAEACAARGVAHETLRWSWDGRGNLQAAARAARCGLVGAWARETGVDRVALAHTRDDVAETFLMRLGRSAGVDGLAEMEARFERCGVTWLRPLLDVPRARLRDYLRDRGVGWDEDPANEDKRFVRARIRALLPALSEAGVDSASIARSARNLSAARAAVDEYASLAARSLAAFEGGDLLLARDPAMPAETARRLLGAAVMYVSGAGYRPREGALPPVGGAPGEGLPRTVGGCVLSAEAGPDGTARIRVCREWNAVRDAACAPGEAWDGRWRVDGPAEPGVAVRALGEAGLADCPDWRGAGLPRRSLMASPAVWRGGRLLAAPVAGLPNGWTAACLQDRDGFAAFLARR